MKKRLPGIQEIISVYAVIAFMLFTWSPILFFWYLPSWLYFMPLGEIVAVYSYIMAASFVESMAFLTLLLFICFVLPPNILKKDFVSRGTVITICTIGLIMINSSVVGFLRTQSGVVLALAIIVGAVFLTRINIIRSVLEAVSDRVTIFLYLIFPISFLSIVIIIFRNIF